MAEPDFPGLDSRLRDALGRAAAPGDSAGVADAIRSRLASGDPGTSVAGPVAPGWGRRMFGMLFGGILLGVLIVGGTATGVGFALTGDAGESAAEPSVQVVPSSAPTATPTPTLTPTSTPTAVETPTEAPAPVPAPAPPPPPADTTAPTVQASSSAPMLYSSNGTATTITATAQDAGGVGQVSIAWSGYYTGSGSMTFSGGAWTYVFAPGPGPAGSGQVDFVVTAVDAAGNQASTTVTVPVSP